MQDDGIPHWVEDELHNWVRSQWDGPGVGPPLVSLGSAEKHCPSGIDRESDDEPPRVQVNWDRARAVHRLYEALPLVEQRIVQAEYTRRWEYGDLLAHQRRAAAARAIGVGPAYYRVALGMFKREVWEELR